MSITLTGTGGLFTRLGKLFQIKERVYTHQTDASAGIEKETLDLVAEFADADLHMLQQIPQTILQHQMIAAGFYTALDAAAANIVIEMADAAYGLPARTLDEALKALITQMESDSDTVDGSTLTLTMPSPPFPATGDGSAYVIFDDNYEYGDNSIQYARDDLWIVRCTGDAQVTGTAGRETFTVFSSAANPDTRDPDWPGGTGQSFAVRATDANETPGKTVGRTSLRNGSFETFTVANIPDDWQVAVGAAGTDFGQGAEYYRGAASLELINTATLASLYQNLDGSDGAKLIPSERYMLLCRYRCDAGTSAGAVTIDLSDSGGSSFGTPVVLNSYSTSWAIGYAVQDTPAVLPSSPRLRVRVTTQLTGGSMYIDDLVLARMYRLGTSGPWCVVIPGQTPFVLNDEARFLCANNWEGKFQYHFEKAFGLYARGLTLPYDTTGSETIADSLIG